MPIETVKTGRYAQPTQNWASNIVPFIQALGDVKKYQMGKKDKEREALMTALMSAGAMWPKGQETQQFGGMNLQPQSTEDVLARSGKQFSGMQDYYSLMKTMEEVNKMQQEDQTRQAFAQMVDQGNLDLYDVQQNIPGGGRMSYMPKEQTPEKKGLLSGFFQKKAAPATVADVGNKKRQMAIQWLTDNGAPITPKNIAAVMERMGE